MGGGRVDRFFYQLAGQTMPAGVMPHQRPVHPQRELTMVQPDRRADSLEQSAQPLLDLTLVRACRGMQLRPRAEGEIRQQAYKARIVVTADSVAVGMQHF